MLEQIRLISNLETDTEKLIQIVLMGQSELRDMLARHELRQLAQRVTARYHLTPLVAGRDRASTSATGVVVAGGEGKVGFTAAAPWLRSIASPAGSRGSSTSSATGRCSPGT